MTLTPEEIRLHREALFDMGLSREACLNLLNHIDSLEAENARLREALTEAGEALSLAKKFGSQGEIEFDDNHERVGKSVSAFIEKAIDSARAALEEGSR